MKLIEAQEIARSLSYSTAKSLMREVFAEFEGAVCPLRSAMPMKNGKGVLGVMPAQIASGALGAKLVTVIPDNSKKRLEVHQGVVALFSQDTGKLVALFDASEITSIRTAAVSVLATELIVNTPPKIVAIFGAGNLARHHIAAFQECMGVERFLLYARDPKKAESLAQEFPDLVKTVGSVEELLKDADVLCTLTSSQTPILNEAPSSLHINAVGACRPHHREIGSQLIAKAQLFVDSHESAEAEAGEILLARKEGFYPAIELELSELVKEKKFQRKPNTPTLFKSLGLGIEDIACAQYLFTKGL
jgi:alanine dehydrogenase